MRVGDTKLEPCSWCGVPIIKVYVPYPRATMIAGCHWDESACDCINGLQSEGGDVVMRRMGRSCYDPKRYMGPGAFKRADVIARHLKRRASRDG